MLSSQDTISNCTLERLREGSLAKRVEVAGAHVYKLSCLSQRATHPHGSPQITRPFFSLCEITTQIATDGTSQGWGKCSEDHSLSGKYFGLLGHSAARTIKTLIPMDPETHLWELSLWRPFTTALSHTLGRCSVALSVVENAWHQLC
jgi:hypothetical protein